MRGHAFESKVTSFPTTLTQTGSFIYMKMGTDTICIVVRIRLVVASATHNPVD